MSRYCGRVGAPESLGSSSTGRAVFPRVTVRFARVSRSRALAGPSSTSRHSRPAEPGQGTRIGGGTRRLRARGKGTNPGAHGPRQLERRPPRTNRAPPLPRRDLEQAVAQAEREGLVTFAELRNRIAAAHRRPGSALLREVLDLEGGPVFTRSEAERRPARVDPSREPAPPRDQRPAGALRGGFPVARPRPRRRGRRLWLPPLERQLRGRPSA
jgi:hypothetical protein